MKASLNAGSPKGQPRCHTLPRVSGGVTTPEALHRRRCHLELELIGRGIESPEQAADLLLRQQEAGR